MHSKTTGETQTLLLYSCFAQLRIFAWCLWFFSSFFFWNSISFYDFFLIFLYFKSLSLVLLSSGNQRKYCSCSFNQTYLSLNRILCLASGTGLKDETSRENIISKEINDQSSICQTDSLVLMEGHHRLWETAETVMLPDGKRYHCQTDSCSLHTNKYCTNCI